MKNNSYLPARYSSFLPAERSGRWQWHRDRCQKHRRPDPISRRVRPLARILVDVGSNLHRGLVDLRRVHDLDRLKNIFF